jgi:hypothetical protein
MWLNFGHRDGSSLTDLDAALTAQALFFVDHDRFFILHFKDAYRTNIDALFVASALVGIHFHTPCHKYTSFENWLTSDRYGDLMESNPWASRAA